MGELINVASSLYLPNSWLNYIISRLKSVEKPTLLMNSLSNFFLKLLLHEKSFVGCTELDGRPYRRERRFFLLFFFWADFTCLHLVSHHTILFCIFFSQDLLFFSVCVCFRLSFIEKLCCSCNDLQIQLPSIKRFLHLHVPIYIVFIPIW